jgi:hypothetical protein
MRPRSPLVPLLVGLVCAQAACNLGSLDYLQNGTKRDGGDGDGQRTSNLDSTSSDEAPLAGKPDVTVLDGKASEVPLGSDGSGDLFTNIPVLDAQEERERDLGTDTFIPDTKSPDGALPDATNPDGAIPDSLSNLDTLKQDGLISDSYVPVPDSYVPDSPPDLYVGGPDSLEVASDSPTAKPSVRFVVGATTPLSAADTAIQSHLTAKGYDVTLILDSAPAATLTETLVLISRSVSSASVGTKYRNVAKPVLVNEPNLFAIDMGLVSGSTGTASSTGATPGADSVDVQAAAGALAAGLSGTIKVFNTAQDVTYGVPSTTAILVAALSGQTKYPIFAYETGAQMSGLAAPARRMGFFLSGTSATSLTANGWLLFDAAIAWLAKSG